MNAKRLVVPIKGKNWEKDLETVIHKLSCEADRVRNTNDTARWGMPYSFLSELLTESCKPIAEKHPDEFFFDVYVDDGDRIFLGWLYGKWDSGEAEPKVLTIEEFEKEELFYT